MGGDAVGVDPGELLGFDESGLVEVDGSHASAASNHLERELAGNTISGTSNGENFVVNVHDYPLLLEMTTDAPPALSLLLNLVSLRAPDGRFAAGD